MDSLSSVIDVSPTLQLSTAQSLADALQTVLQTTAGLAQAAPAGARRRRLEQASSSPASGAGDTSALSGASLTVLRGALGVLDKLAAGVVAGITTPGLAPQLVQTSYFQLTAQADYPEPGSRLATAGLPQGGFNSSFAPFTAEALAQLRSQAGGSAVITLFLTTTFDGWAGARTPPLPPGARKPMSEPYRAPIDILSTSHRHPSRLRPPARLPHTRAGTSSGMTRVRFYAIPPVTVGPARAAVAPAPIFVANVSAAAPSQFTMPAAWNLVTRTSLFAACSIWNGANYTMDGCATLPPRRPPGHTVSWSMGALSDFNATYGPPPPSMLHSAWALDGPLMQARAPPCAAHAETPLGR